MGDEDERLASGESWREFCGRLQAAGERILAEGFPDTPRDRAEGVRWLTRLINHATQMEIEAGDPAHPVFVRYETPHNQWGGPNPDNTYLRANVDPSHAYRIWSDVRGVRQLIVSLNEGEMQLGEYGVYGERSLDDFEIGPDGRLEIWLSREERPGNWIPMHEKGRLFTVRVYHGDWERDVRPVFHIERVGAEGVPRAPIEPAFVNRALDRTATWVERTAEFWNAYTTAGWDRATPNVATPPRAAKGGADNILYGSCFWELASHQALVLTCAPPAARVWGFTIHTLGWLESGDFADRQTSISGDQMHVDDDGRFRVILAATDPGTPNWIDIEERPRGLLVYRWVWTADNPVPMAQVAPLSEVRSLLPADHPRIDFGERRRRLARRRENAWNRFQ